MDLKTAIQRAHAKEIHPSAGQRARWTLDELMTREQFFADAVPYRADPEVPFVIVVAYDAVGEEAYYLTELNPALAQADAQEISTHGGVHHTQVHAGPQASIPSLVFYDGEAFVP